MIFYYVTSRNNVYTYFIPYKAMYAHAVEISPLKLLNKNRAKKSETIFMSTSVTVNVLCTLSMTVSGANKAFFKL